MVHAGADGPAAEAGRPQAGRAGGASQAQVGGFPLALDRLYHTGTHMWVWLTAPDHARIGMDSLGVETSGTLAELSLPPVRAELAAGRPFGQLEAAKFVGPLVSPVSGTVLAVNEAVAADPGLAEREPYGAGWLIEAELSSPAEELPGLLGDPEEITRWFAAAVADYRRKGVIAQ
jgi:glycine cleavage system H protein